MERRKFSRAFKLEAVKFVRDRGVLAAQASREMEADPVQPFPGMGR